MWLAQDRFLSISNNIVKGNQRKSDLDGLGQLFIACQSNYTCNRKEIFSRLSKTALIKIRNNLLWLLQDSV